MRLRSASTQNSFPSLLSRARATGLMRPVVNRDSRSVPSRLAPSILAERSCTVVKYMYLQSGQKTHLGHCDYSMCHWATIVSSQLYSSNQLSAIILFLPYIKYNVQYLDATTHLFCNINSLIQKKDLTLSQHWSQWPVACRCRPSRPRPQCVHPSSGRWWCWKSHRSSKCGDCRGPGSGHEAGCPLAGHCCWLSWRAGGKHSKVISVIQSYVQLTSCSLSHYDSTCINLHLVTVTISVWSCMELG